jgi:hypothetical protein
MYTWYARRVQNRKRELSAITKLDGSEWILARGSMERSGGLTPGETTPTQPRQQQQRRPVSITVIAIFLVLGVPGMLWWLYLTFPTRMTGIPTMVLGVLVSGWGATTLNLALLSAQLSLGLGLWRMRPWARTGAIAYFSFSIVNLTAMALWPDNFSRIVTTMRAANPAFPSVPQDFHWFIAVFSEIGLAAAALWFLIKRKAAFAN